MIMVIRSVTNYADDAPPTYFGNVVAEAIIAILQSRVRNIYPFIYYVLLLQFISTNAGPVTKSLIKW